MSALPPVVHLMSVSQAAPDKPVELICTACQVSLETFPVDPQTRMTALAMMEIVAKAVESFRQHAKVDGKCGQYMTDHLVADLIKKS
jgi:hypothetical protein